MCAWPTPASALLGPGEQLDAAYRMLLHPAVVVIYGVEPGNLHARRILADKGRVLLSRDLHGRSRVIGRARAKRGHAELRPVITLTRLLRVRLRGRTLANRLDYEGAALLLQILLVDQGLVIGDQADVVIAVGFGHEVLDDRKSTRL